MCGVAGYQGDFDTALLERFTKILAHRGPDDCGTYRDAAARVGFSHTRLSILDVSNAGHQPMVDQETGAAIVLNGEIYNFRELRADLEARGHRFRSTSDTEVLLRMFVQFGTDMLPRLNGIFAVALWDPRDRTLIVARDGFGVKPLYYASTAKGVVFASELKALLLEPSVDRTLDLQAVGHHLRYLWCPAPHTMLASVKKLSPGHVLVIRDGHIADDRQFYSLPCEERTSKLSVREAGEELRFLLDRAVSRQMVSDVPVGAFLSGGLDSSSVVAFARRHASHSRFPCFTIGFKEGSTQTEGFAEDLPYARQAARQLGVDLHTVLVGHELADDLVKMVYYLDEPQADLAPLNVLRIAELARSQGIKVLLSGAGGDDIFTGYRRHRALMLERYWTWLPKIAKRGLHNGSQLLPQHLAWGRRIGKAFHGAALDGDARIVDYFTWTDAATLDRILSAPVRDAQRAVANDDPLFATLKTLPVHTHPLARMLLLDTKFFLADHNLNYTDKMAMAAGVEVRVPLLDSDLVRFAAGLPVTYKQHGAAGKWIFKKAMEPILPRNVIYRPKSGFGVPLREWLHRGLRPLVEDVLSPRSLADTGLFDPEGVRQLLHKDRAGAIDAAYPILSMVCIQLWCQRFLRSGDPELSEPAAT